MIGLIRKVCLSIGVIGLLPASGFACSVCFGDQASALGQGAKWGVLAMIAVVACVLSGISAFFVFLGKRSAAVSEAESSAALPELTDKD
ncbi:MAG: hypothetical protein O2960_03115 [Verrucomicrobia bacterium]|nr:hypothetical protein [Verrucomicrobiota bacterium]